MSGPASWQWMAVLRILWTRHYDAWKAEQRLVFSHVQQQSVVSVQSTAQLRHSSVSLVDQTVWSIHLKNAQMNEFSAYFSFSYVDFSYITALLLSGFVIIIN